MVIPVTSSPQSGVSQPIPSWRSFFLRPELLSCLSSPTRRGGADSITSPGSSSRSSTSPSCDTLLALFITTMPATRSLSTLDTRHSTHYYRTTFSVSMTFSWAWLASEQSPRCFAPPKTPLVPSLSFVWASTWICGPYLSSPNQ